MIKDRELLDIYQISSEEHLEKIKAGLEELEQNPSDSKLLEELWQEFHSLKQDSTMVEIESVEAVTNCLENIIKSIKNKELDFTSKIGEVINSSLGAIAQLIQSALTGTNSEVNVPEILHQLDPINSNTIGKNIVEFPETEEITPVETTKKNGNGSNGKTKVIQDLELRDIYKITSEQHLQKLEAGLLELEQNPSDKKCLEELIEEAHGLKQDSTMVEVESVELLVDYLEEILASIKSDQVFINPEVSASLHHGLEAISKLIEEAITGTPSGVDISALLKDLYGEKEKLELIDLEEILGEIFGKETIENQELELEEDLVTTDSGEILGEETIENQELELEEDLVTTDSGEIFGKETIENQELELEEDLVTTDSGEIFGKETIENQELELEEDLVTTDSGEIFGKETIENQELELEEDLVTTDSGEIFGKETIENQENVNENEVEIIEDEELREIYKTASEEHLAKLETGLKTLENDSEKPGKIQELLKETHSIKGDSRIVGVESVENITIALENVLKSLQNKERELNPEINQLLNEGLGGIKLLVKEAVTGTSSGINVAEILNKLQAVISEEEKKLQEATIIEEELASIELAEEISYYATKYIEDDELRGIYKESSKEHLQKLEAGLLALEKNPEENSRLEELMREAHSLKGDSRITEVESVENIAHVVEDLFSSIIKKEVKLTPEISDRLYEAVDGMTKLVEEAVTGNPSGVNVAEILSKLRGKIPNVALEKPKVEQPKSKPKTLVKTVGESYRIDTIRVKTEDLDALMTQAGELTVTKIRIAHLGAQVEEVASLWEELQNSKQQRNVLGEEIINYEERLNKIIEQLKTTSQENSARLDLISGELEEKIRTLRLLPLSTVFNLFPRMVRDLAKEEGKEVELIIEGGETVADKQILEEIKDPLMHILRNAIDHGIETPEERENLGKPRQATLYLRGAQSGSNIYIEISDDGRGLEIEKIKKTAIEQGIVRQEELATMTENQIQNLIFTHGFSTRNFITEVSGRGVGLDVVRTNIERLKGNIELESVVGQGCTFRLSLGTTLATANVLLVDVQGIVHAIPIEFVQSNLLISFNDIFTIEGKQTIILNKQAVSVANLADILELSDINTNQNQRNQNRLTCVLLNIGKERLGVLVDRVLDTQDVVIKPQSKLLKRVRNVSGATILGTGEVCMILNPQDLLASVHNNSNSGNFFDRQPLQAVEKEKTKPVILLADDSIAVRTQEKRILDAAGYEVITAVDGVDGLNKLKNRHFDAIISDVQMPNLDGLSFTAKVRNHPEYNEIPVILVTSLGSDEDKRKGAEAGANAYIVKGKFNQDVLLETLERLV